AALMDAGALHDPIVGRVDLAREFGVGEDLARQIAAAAQYNGAAHRHDAAPRSAFCRSPCNRPSAAVILASSSSRTTPWPSSIAAAKPSASVPPWLLMTMPFSPRKTP